MPSPAFLLPRLLTLSLTAALLAGCLSQAEKPQPPQLDQSTDFTATVESVAAQTQPWWEASLPEPIASQVDQVLRNSPAILEAAQQVALSRAQLDQAEAERWIDIGASASSRVQSVDGDRSDTQTLGLDARLPLDLFDKLAFDRSAAAAEFAGSLAQLEQSRLEQVRAYLLQTINAAEAEQRLALLEQQITTVRTLLRLTEYRFSQGLVSSVDVLQQREQLASLRLQPGLAQLERRQALSAMSELRGELPSADSQPPAQIPRIGDRFAVPRPALLLQRRPDLIARRSALLAQDARYEAALRERLPAATLSASGLLRLVSGNPDAIIGAALEASASLFDSGRLDARVAEHRAALESSGIAYLQAWLAAVRETDDLVNALRTSQDQLKQSEQRSAVAQELFLATRRRYERGISDYLPVLAALRSLQQQQRDHLALQAEHQRIIVRLHTAMGLPGSTQEAGR